MEIALILTILAVLLVTVIIVRRVKKMMSISLVVSILLFLFVVITGFFVCTVIEEMNDNMDTQPRLYILAEDNKLMSGIIIGGK